MSVINFDGETIQIHGTADEPLISYDELFSKILVDVDQNSSKYDSFLNNPVYVKRPEMMVTEIGVMKLLMREDGVKAENFCIKFSETIKNIRQNKYNDGQRVGFIYGFRHKKYGTIDYVGFTQNTIEERQDSHLQQLIQQAKIPFYRCLVVQAFENYQVEELEQIKYVDEKLLRERELYHQLKHNSIQSEKKIQCKKCGKNYVSVRAFEAHRLKCYA